MNAIGIIGGSGLYEITGLEAVEEIELETPFGTPSSPITTGVLDGVKLLFLARHGRGHTLLPSEVNYRANIFALKELGAAWCLSLSACGSLKEECAPGHIVIPDQFIDRTKLRESTFFGDGIVAHIPFADPFCPVLREVLTETAQTLATRKQTKVHGEGTYVCMEGPAFSTRAESKMYRTLGGTIIGMTNLPEAKLAREAEIAYASACFVTDYDCWRSESSDVDIEEILAVLAKNTDLAREIISDLAPKLKEREPSPLSANALKTAILTNPEAISEESKKRLNPLLRKYI